MSRAFGIFTEVREAAMRIDKYLKVARIIKRRTVANEACGQGRVLLNGKAAKAGAEVRAGDVIEVRFGDMARRYRVKEVTEHVPKGDVGKLYEEL